MSSIPILPQCFLKAMDIKKTLVLSLAFFFFLFFNVLYGQDNPSSQIIDRLRQEYEKIKNPEITFQRFVEVNSHVYTSTSTNSNAATLAVQDPYCNKVRSYCTNGDFEAGLDQDKYVGAYGFWYFGLYPDPFALTYGFISGGLFDGNAHQTIVDKASGVDPVAPIPLVAANGGNKALRLGNAVNGNGTELIAKTITVDANESILSFYYALVLQDPGHSFNDQPAFSVRAYDCATGLELTNVCNLGNGTNIAVAASNNPFFQTKVYQFENLVYRDWSLAQINLSAHVGKKVILVFTVKDCNLGGHFGYVYLDNLFSSQCPVGGPILTGQGSITLNASATSTCATGQICANYTLPTTNAATGSINISLDIYQNSTKVITLTSGLLTSGTSYCFNINPATLGLNANLGGFDYTLTGNFTLSGFSLSPIVVGNPPTGQINGVNNDYLIVCPSSPIYYSKASGDLHDVLTWGLNMDGSGANPADFNDSTFQLANRPAVYTMTGDWTVNGGIINIPAARQLQIAGFTLTLTNLDPLGLGTISGSPTSNLAVIGTNGGNIGLNFTPASNMLNNFTVNRTGTGASATIGSAVNILGVLTSTSGMLTTGGLLTLKSTAANTARVAPVTGSISGNVTVERYIPARRAWRILSAPVGGISDAASGQATLSHSQETVQGALTTSNGNPRPLSFGSATFSLNAARTALTFTATIFNIDVNKLQTPNDANDDLTAAHIHVGAPIGANANVRWGFFGAPLNDNNPSQLVITPFATGVGGTFSSTWDLPEGNSGTTLTTNLPGIFAGLSYINFHTTQFGGGEIRGQISLVGAGTQTINQAWQEGTILGQSPNPNPVPGFGTHITGGPIFGTVANGFDQNPVGASSSIKRYNSIINNWEPLPNTNATSVGGEAYFTFVRGNRALPIGYNDVPPSITTLRAQGPLRIGDQTFQVAGTAFTAIGNPFASPINFATITRSGVQNNFYLWDPKMGTTGAYVLLSNDGMGGYTITPAAVSPESQYIQSGQGFLVRPDVNGVAGSVTIKESDKSATAATDVFRTAGGITNAISNEPKFVDPSSGQGLRITLKEIAPNASAIILDEVFSSYRSAYSEKLDNLDAVKLENVQENLGIIREGQLLMLERKPLPHQNDIIALKLWNTVPKTYVLEIAPINLAATGLTALLEDKYLRTSTPIDLTRASQVNFSITSDAASARSDRFQVVLNAKRGIPDELTNVSKSNITAYPNPTNGRNINLSFANKPDGLYQVTLVNATGQIVLRKNIQHAGGSATQVVLLDKKLTSGSYMLKVSSKEEITVISLISN